ncbi:MAG: hypothetical protein R2873_28260 [Caldilineaceae bacterium]
MDRRTSNAEPSWVNLWPGVNKPETLIFSSSDEGFEKSCESVSEGITDVLFEFPFEYTYDGFPQDAYLLQRRLRGEASPRHHDLAYPRWTRMRLGELTVQRR